MKPNWFVWNVIVEKPNEFSRCRIKDVSKQAG